MLEKLGYFKMKVIVSCQIMFYKYFTNFHKIILENLINSGMDNIPKMFSLVSLSVMTDSQ